MQKKKFSGYEFVPSGYEFVPNGYEFVTGYEFVDVKLSLTVLFSLQIYRCLKYFIKLSSVRKYLCYKTTYII